MFGIKELFEKFWYHDKEIRELKSKIVELEWDVYELKTSTIPRKTFDALLEYLKLDLKRVEAHVEFFPRRNDG